MQVLWFSLFCLDSLGWLYTAHPSTITRIHAWLGAGTAAMVGASWTACLLPWRHALPWFWFSSLCLLSLASPTASSLQPWRSRGSGRGIITSWQKGSWQRQATSLYRSVLLQYQGQAECIFNWSIRIIRIQTCENLNRCAANFSRQLNLSLLIRRNTWWKTFTATTRRLSLIRSTRNGWRCWSFSRERGAPCTPPVSMARHQHGSILSASVVTKKKKILSAF